LKLADPRADDHLSLPQLLRLLPLRAIKGDANTDIGASQVEEFLAFSVHADPNGRQRESGTDDVLAIAAGKQSQMLSPARRNASTQSAQMPCVISDSVPCCPR
jgi:hypothetical protein